MKKSDHAKMEELFANPAFARDFGDRRVSVSKKAGSRDGIDQITPITAMSVSLPHLISNVEENFRGEEEFEAFEKILNSNVIPKVFVPGQVIIRKHDIGTEMYFLVKGPKA